MRSGKKILMTAVKAGAVVLLGAGAFVGVASTAASADGKGNVTNNCYAVWWTHDWNQECGSGGASAAGVYYTHTRCNAQGDKDLNKRRAKGNAKSYDGEDCRFSIEGSTTTWGP
jgi:hypothetical protein